MHMRRYRAPAVALAILAIASAARADAPLPPALQVLGSVTTAARPVANALVIALNLTSLQASETFTAVDGSFNMPSLPAAVYKIIAVKSGFVPAMAMIVPTKEKHRVSLALKNEKTAGRDTNQQIWELRASLPPDVLRDIDNVLRQPQAQMASLAPMLATPRFRGQMTSITGVPQQSSSPTYAQTALGVESRLGESWQLGFRGNLHRVDDPTDDARFGTPLAESSAMQMELRSSPTEAYKLASTKSWWRYRDDDVAPQHADIRSHNFEWEHGDAKLQVRYLEQQNLFTANPGSDLIEVAGNTTILQAGRTDIGVSLRVAQESLHNMPNATFRTADLTANANVDVNTRLMLQYGVSSRLGLYGTEWAPRTGAEWKIGKETSLVASGLYKVYQQDQQNAMPAIVVWSDESRVLPKYAYSVGIVSGDESHNGVTIVGTVMRADAPLRVIFTDGFEQFWDGLYVDAGDVRRDLRVNCRKELAKRVLVDISSSAGYIRPALPSLIDGNKNFVTGDVQSTYEPTGTTFAVSYREMRQPQQNRAGGDYRSERVNVRVAQALHFLLDLKLLVGVEVARADNSPYLLDTIDPNGVTRKYIGGLGINF
jgi:Carboxypeptidase regulatory-like domain